MTGTYSEYINKYHEDLKLLKSLYNEYRREPVKFVITFTYKEESIAYRTNQFYCFTSHRTSYDYYDEALKVARELARKHIDKLIYVTKVLSVSEYKPPVPVDDVVTKVLG